jgi:hypothetical protein
MKQTKGITKKRKIKTKLSAVTKEEKAILLKLHRISINARRRARNNDADITIIRNGEIIRISAKGKKKVIGKVKRNPLKVDTSKPVRIK